MPTLNYLKPTPVSNKVRIGREADGGYVLYEGALLKSNVLVSYGVGWETSFEEHFNKVTQSKVLMFDHTMFGKYMLSSNLLKKFILSLRIKKLATYLSIILKAWRKRTQLKKRGIIFINEGVSVTPAAKCRKIGDHFQCFKLEQDQILLKIDIEGGEYDLLGAEETYRYFGNVNQLVIEFHDLKNRMREVEQILDRLRTSGFELIHIHGNNCGSTFVLYDPTEPGKDIHVPDVLELTLVKKNCIKKEHFLADIETYPVSSLDFPNDLLRAQYEINFG